MVLQSTLNTPYSIRKANLSDFEAIYDIFKKVLAEGSTYAYTLEEMTPDRSMAYWMSAPGTHCLVADVNEQVAGMAAIRPNASDMGRANHVANGSFIVGEEYRGQGIARALGVAGLKLAKQLDYKAMQFNFVVSTNDIAVKLWQSLGFEIVGTLPKGFDHAQHGFVDVFVMHRFLDDVDASDLKL